MESGSGEKAKTPVHIVIGAGPGGILCSYELSKYGEVILLERGSILLADEKTIEPQQWGTEFSSGKHTELIETIPQERLFSRKILYPLGISVGGSSNINAMIFTGGHPSIFDKYWPVEWNSARFTRLLQKVHELVKPRVISATSIVSGIIGSVNLQHHHQTTTEFSSEMWNTTASQSSYMTTISEKSQRLSLHQRILEPLIHQKRVHLQCYKKVETILLKRIPLSCDFIPPRPYIALGVIVKCMLTNEHQFITPENGGEIVIASGALNSPQLLLKSIILPEDYSICSISDNLQFFCCQQLEKDHENEVIDDPSPPSIEARSKKSHSSFPKFSLPDIGKSLLDHTILPFICVGNWWNSHLLRNFPYFSSTTDPEHDPAAYPPNSIHGWIYLNENGDIYNPLENPSPPRSVSPPLCSSSAFLPPVRTQFWIRIQLVFVDGRVLCGSMFAEMLLPRFSSSWYQQIIRPMLFEFIQLLTSLSIIQLLLSCVLGVLICDVQPKQSIGKIEFHNNSMRVDPQYSTQSEDVALFWKAYHTIRSIFSRSQWSFSSSTSSSFLYFELLPGPLFFYCFTLSLFEIFYCYFLGTYFHFCGTNPMTCTPPSPSPSSTSSTQDHNKPSQQCQNQESSPVGVVNESLKVHLVEKLRVVDSSIFPHIPSAPIAAIVMAVGLAGGELINQELNNS